VRKDNPSCRILFIPVKPSIARWKKFDVQSRANTLVRDDCARVERLVYVDIVPLMLGAEGAPSAELFVKDGLHLSPKGYEIWTAAVKKALKE
jgi:lysophospholipase L1-like esterase